MENLRSIRGSSPQNSVGLLNVGLLPAGGSLCPVTSALFTADLAAFVDCFVLHASSALQEESTQTVLPIFYLI